MSAVLSRISEPDPVAARPHFFRWAFPGSPVNIRLKIDLVPEIYTFLARGFGPSPKRPVERWGILLGTMQRNHVAITSFEPLELPVYPQLIGPENGEQGFCDAIARCSLPNSPVTAIGYFRGNLRKHLALDMTDLSLIERYFRRTSNIFLLVNPPGPEEFPMGDFFFRDNGKVFTESIFPFPFDEGLLEMRARTALARTGR